MMKLYDYWRSGAAHRVRIGLALKGLPVDAVSIDLAAGAQDEPAYAAINPQRLVPALETPEGLISQSLAILEWLDETRPEPPLLPRDPFGRARVRALAGVPACDIHPLGNRRVLVYLRETFGADEAAIKAWALRWIGDGLGALEGLLADAPAGDWCWGETPGLADCAIVPQLYAAISRYDYDLARHPRLAHVYAAAQAHPAFVAAHPDRAKPPA